MQKVCLVLYDIRSTHNVGSMFRSADGLGAEIVLVGITPRPIGDTNDDRLPHVSKKAHDAIAKTALGAENTVPWHYFQDSIVALEYLKNRDYYIAALEQDVSSVTITKHTRSKDIALIVGPEVSGLPDDVLKSVDVIYEIPMIGAKESFNVSVAAALALYEFRREHI